jgi:hypothetical protein
MHSVLSGKNWGNEMKYPGYREAIRWLAYNDDNEWLKDDEPTVSVTAAMVCDLFAVEECKLIHDLHEAIAKRDRCSALEAERRNAARGHHITSVEPDDTQG